MTYPVAQDIAFLSNQNVQGCTCFHGNIDVLWLCHKIITQNRSINDFALSGAYPAKATSHSSPELVPKELFFLFPGVTPCSFIIMPSASSATTTTSVQSVSMDLDGRQPGSTYTGYPKLSRNSKIASSKGGVASMRIDSEEATDPMEKSSLRKKKKRKIPLLSCRADDEMWVDISTKRLPGSRLGSLYAGSRFEGIQKCGSTSYDVVVDIQVPRNITRKKKPRNTLSPLSM